MKISRKVIALAVLAGLAFTANAADGEIFTREPGVIFRIGAGSPANVDLGFGYQFNPHFSISAEALSYSGLTTMCGVLDARYYLLDKPFTPFVDAKAGYGTLGTNYECEKYRDFLSTVTAGLSWRRFDIGAGFDLDSFHKAEFILNVCWTFSFR